jgi:hypothetical protein
MNGNAGVIDFNQDNGSRNSMAGSDVLKIDLLGIASQRHSNIDGSDELTAVSNRDVFRLGKSILIARLHAISEPNMEQVSTIFWDFFALCSRSKTRE